jgi:transcriptional regulator with XRE-family HTH domain
VEDPEEVIKRVGLRISELRAEAKLTQAQVAESLETTVSNYQRIEHGFQNLTIRMIVRIAGAIGVPSTKLWERPASRQIRRGRPKRT